eukprot:Hpha_TRINITY_DN15565_c4_g2::TRINITY_DN15565_c4_g2_i1::g.107997::m.107997/K14786/KRI1; protein KRI1
MGRRKQSPKAGPAAKSVSFQLPEKEKKKPKMDLFGDDSDEGGDEGFTVNKEYSSKFESEKQRREMESLKSKRSEWEDEDSSEDTIEDDQANLLNDDRDVEIHAALLDIRKGRLDKAAERISRVNKEVKEDVDRMMEDKDSDEEEKPYTMRDQFRDQLLKRGAKGAAFADEEEELEIEKKWGKTAGSKEAAESDSAKAMFKQMVEDEEGGFDLVKKDKTSEQKQEEEKGYKAFLKTKEGRKREKEKSAEERLAALFEGVDPSDEKESFLANFFTNQGWQSAMDDVNPSAEDIDRVVRQGKEEDRLDDAQEDFEAEFEKKYESQKYRHEEEEAGAIESHPRAHLIQDSLREERNARKEARQRKKEREAEAKIRRDEEINREKFLRRKEMDKKVNDLQKIAGMSATKLFDLAALDEDFDPDTWDQKMTEFFDKEYYDDDDDAFDPFADFQIEGLDEEGEENEEEEQEKPMPEAPTAAQKKEMEKRKRKLVKAKEEAINQAMDDYYKLDYEDVIDGQKVRFNYRQVPKETFGLSDKDVLNWDDRTLNKVSPLKFYAPYRSVKENRKDRQIVIHNKQSIRRPADSVAQPSKKYRTGLAPVEVIENVGTVVGGVDEETEERKREKKKEKRKQRRQATAAKRAGKEADGGEEGEQLGGQKRKKKEAEEEWGGEEGAEAAAAPPKRKRRRKPKSER